jgi:hypothetical protein
MVTLDNSGMGTVRASVSRPLPDWSLLVSDIVCDLRFILDNLAYELVIANTGADPPPNERGIEFPIFDDKGKFMQTRNDGRPVRISGLAKIGDMDAWVQRMIEELQPYHEEQPQNNGFMNLNEMCNTYKHRLLAPVLLSLERASLTFEPVNCQITEAVTYRT